MDRFINPTGPKASIGSISEADTIGLVDRIAKLLVDNPHQVQVTPINGANTTVLELKVAKEDLGKVIGKQGRTAQAIRVLLSAVSSKTKQHIVLEIVE